MSSRTAEVHAARRRAATRRRAPRRRRGLLALLGVGAIVLLVVAIAPMFKTAVRDLSLPLRHADIIRQQAQAKQLDPALIAAVIETESKFDPRPSAAGAEGLMQLLPSTARFIARRSGGSAFEVADLATPRVNIAYGAYYLRYLLDRYGNDTMLALAAYNGGETNVNRWLSSAKARGHALRVGDIPFPETRAYVRRVLRLQGEYRATYAHELGLG
jgi:soluble lytic murein transglycosylase